MKMGPGKSLVVKTGVPEEAINSKRSLYKYVWGVGCGESGGRNGLGPIS